jgi:hypothetical protein
VTEIVRIDAPFEVSQCKFRSSVWIGLLWLIGSAAFAGLVLPLTVALAGHQNSDGILTALISTRKLTWYFWGQDRLLNLLPALASGINDVEWNLRVQLFLRAAMAWLSPLGILVFFSRSPLFLALATAIANVILTVCSEQHALFKQLTLFNLYAESNLFCTSLVLLALAYVIFTARLHRLVAVLFTFAVCCLAFTCNFALLIYAVPLLAILTVLRPQQRRSLFMFLLINVAAIIVARVHSKIFGEPITTYRLAPALSSIVEACRTIYAQIHPLPTLGFGLLALIACRFDSRRRPLELLAVLALALAMIVFLANTAWVQMNLFDIRYFLTPEIIFASLMAYPITTLVFAASCRYAVLLGVPLAMVCTLSALGGFNSDYNELVDAPFRQSSHALGAAAADQGVRAIIGDYWHVWPTIYETERLKAEQKTATPRIYGVTYRGQTLRDEFLRDVKNDRQIAFCLFDQLEYCADELLRVFRIAAGYQVATDSAEKLYISNLPVIKFGFRLLPRPADAAMSGPPERSLSN